MSTVNKFYEVITCKYSQKRSKSFKAFKSARENAIGFKSNA